MDDYKNNPKCCRFCKTPLPYEKRRNDFCSQSCAAKLNNTINDKHDVRRPEIGRIFKKKNPDAPDRLCFHCGEKIMKGQAKFCSAECRQQQNEKDFFKQLEDNTITYGQSKRLKEYLISLHGDKCLDPECAWDHAKRPIKVELEHKDGNSENNRLENLTLLCPCCHSLTPTYKNKNSGNGRAFRRQRYAEGKSY